MNIVNRLIKLRQLSKQSKKEFAKGIASYSHYCDIEVGVYPPSGIILEAVANKLRYPKEYLLNYRNIDKSYYSR